MAEQILETVFQIIGLYLLAGLVFALLFISAGVSRIDPAAKGAGIGFRLMILPGTILFWPLLAWRWLSGQKQPPAEKRNAHRSSKT